MASECKVANLCEKALESRPIRKTKIDADEYCEGVLLLTPEARGLRIVFFGSKVADEGTVVFLETVLDEETLNRLEDELELYFEDAERFPQVLAGGLRARSRVIKGDTLEVPLSIKGVDNVSVRIKLQRQSNASLTKEIFLDFRAHLVSDDDNAEDTDDNKKRSRAQSAIPLNALPGALDFKRRRKHNIS